LIGLESNDGILMLGSTNHLDNIDEAIRSRPSRFDRKYAFELPDRVGRERYAQYWRGKLADNRDLEFPEEICGLAADLTVGFSFAYLKELFISTLLIVSQGVRGEDLEWDVIEDKSASTSDSGEDISKVDAVEATSVASESTDETTKIVDGEKKGEENLKKRRDMPKIVVPEQLKKNVFLAVLQQQCKLLINGMVNSDAKEEEKKEKKKAKENEEKDKKKDDDHSCAKC
jgi:transitional endoplasmic reticulum ATPase